MSSTKALELKRSVTKSDASEFKRLTNRIVAEPSNKKFWKGSRRGVSQSKLRELLADELTTYRGKHPAGAGKGWSFHPFVRTHKSRPGVFFRSSFLPGTFVGVMLGEKFTEAAIEAAEQKYGSKTSRHTTLIHANQPLYEDLSDPLQATIFRELASDRHWSNVELLSFSGWVFVRTTRKVHKGEEAVRLGPGLEESDEAGSEEEEEDVAASETTEGAAATSAGSEGAGPGLEPGPDDREVIRGAAETLLKAHDDSLAPAPTVVKRARNSTGRLAKEARAKAKSEKMTAAPAPAPAEPRVRSPDASEGPEPAPTGVRDSVRSGAAPESRGNERPPASPQPQTLKSDKPRRPVPPPPSRAPKRPRLSPVATDRERPSLHGEPGAADVEGQGNPNPDPSAAVWSPRTMPEGAPETVAAEALKELSVGARQGSPSMGVSGQLVPAQGGDDGFAEAVVGVLQLPPMDVDSRRGTRAVHVIENAVALGALDEGGGEGPGAEAAAEEGKESPWGLREQRREAGAGSSDPLPWIEERDREAERPREAAAAAGGVDAGGTAAAGDIVRVREASWDSFDHPPGLNAWDGEIDLMGEDEC